MFWSVNMLYWLPVSLILQIFFPCSSNWQQFPWFFTCWTFSDSEFRWNSYLLGSWRGVATWARPYVDCTCPVPLAGELHLMWMQVTLSSRCAGSYHLCGDRGWRCRGCSWSWVWGGTSSLLSGPRCPTGDGIWSLRAGAEALRLGLWLVLFLLSGSFLLSQQQESCPRGDGVLTEGRLIQIPGSCLL